MQSLTESLTSAHTGRGGGGEEKRNSKNTEYFLLKAKIESAEISNLDRGCTSGGVNVTYIYSHAT